MGAIAAAVEAHSSLNRFSEGPQHNLGLATLAAAARGHVSGDEVRLLQKLRRRANDARHVSPSSKDGGRPAAGAIEVLQ